MRQASGADDTNSRWRWGKIPESRENQCRSTPGVLQRLPAGIEAIMQKATEHISDEAYKKNSEHTYDGSLLFLHSNRHNC